MFADEQAWPALTSRELPWRPGLPDDVVPRAVRLRHAGPYRAAVVPTIERRTPTVAPEVLRAAEDAAAEVARFDARMGAEVAPFAAVLLRTESEFTGRRRNRMWQAPAVLEALDAFAARAGRRR